MRKAGGRLGMFLGLAGVACSAHAAVAAVGSTNTTPVATVVCVIGAGGESSYAEAFSQWTVGVKDAVAKGGARLVFVGPQTNAAAVPATGAPSGDLKPVTPVPAASSPSQETESDKARLLRLLGEEPAEGAKELWVILVGHGTHDGREAKFNLQGPDLAATELAAALERFSRPLVIAVCSSAGGAFLPLLSRPGRVVISATKSGGEQNYTRFGGFFCGALANPEADFDKDRQVSSLEAFLYASRSVEEFYKKEARLATEHALIDDNGDKLGTPSDFFKGVQAVKAPRDGGAVDGRRAHQLHLLGSDEERAWEPARRDRRDQLELELWGLRDRKQGMPEEEYYAQLEKILLEISKLTLGTNTPPSASPRP